MSRVIALAAILAAGSGLAQGLAPLLDAADRQNLDRRVAAEQRGRAEAEYRQAWTALIPSLSASGAWSHNQHETVISQPNATGGVTKLVIVPGDQLDATFRIDLPLIDTGRWYRAAATSSAQEGAAEREQQTRDLVRRQVISGWYGYAAALKVRESAKKSLGVSEEQARLQAIRASAGAATELELLRAKAEAQRNRQVVADTEHLVAVSRRALRTLTFVDPGEVAELPADDLSPEPPFEELEKNVEALPAVKAADSDAQVAGKLGTAQQLALVPVVGAHFTERLSNATGFSGNTGNFATGINLSWRLDVPMFQAMQVQQAQQSIAQLSADRARLQARDQIHTDWQRHHAALTKVESARAQVEAAGRAAQVARDRYAAGASTQVDVIQAERDLFSAEVGQIQARTELASARASLRISAGLPLGIE